MEVMDNGFLVETWDASRTPVPVRTMKSFVEMGLPSTLLDNVAAIGYSTPTQVQAYAIPTIQTGSPPPCCCPMPLPACVPKAPIVTFHCPTAFNPHICCPSPRLLHCSMTCTLPSRWFAQRKGGGAPSLHGALCPVTFVQPQTALCALIALPRALPLPHNSCTYPSP